jgi:hypothetical protein
MPRGGTASEAVLNLIAARLRSKEFELTVSRATAARIGVEFPSGLKADAVY